MAPITRRRALQGAVGALAALAGCRTDRDGTAADRQFGTATDPAHVVLRGDEGPLAWYDEPDERGETPEPVGPEQGTTRGFVATEATAATLSVGDVQPTEHSGGPADVQGLVDGTDFESETLYLERMGVPECHRLALCYVRWTPADFETQYGRFLRDHDVACRRDSTDELAVLIRVPTEIDPGSRSSFGSGVHGDGCHPPPGRRGGDRRTPPDRGTASDSPTPDTATTAGSSGGDGQ